MMKRIATLGGWVLRGLEWAFGGHEGSPYVSPYRYAFVSGAFLDPFVYAEWASRRLEQGDGE